MDANENEKEDSNWEENTRKIKELGEEISEMKRQNPTSE